MTPTSFIREKQAEPRSRSTREPQPAIVTRAESAPCTCPEHCERDHEND